MAASSLDLLLARLPNAGELDLQLVFEALYETRFTGSMTFDFLNGRPRQINLGQPIRLAICSGARLDKSDPPGTG